jgi:hypothetical protein
VSTLDAYNCKDFFLVCIIMFNINKLSYYFNLCLDIYGSMVVIKFMILFNLVASCCSFWINSLHIAWVLNIFLINNVSWVLANITSKSSHCFQKGNKNSRQRLCMMVCPSFWEDYYMLIYTHCWELMNSLGSHGTSSRPFVMKVMVCHFVNDSHEVMTTFIVMLPLIVVVEISL